MKNFLKTSLYIAVFALAGVFFQISCSNSDDGQTLNTLTPSTEKLVFVKKDFVNGPYEQSIWICNTDGSDLTQIPITLPTGVVLYRFYGSGEHSSTKLSQDGQTLFFTAQNQTTNETFVYSCGIDGTNVQQVVALDAEQGVFL